MYLLPGACCARLFTPPSLQRRCSVLSPSFHPFFVCLIRTVGVYTHSGSQRERERETEIDTTSSRPYYMTCRLLLAAAERRSCSRFQQQYHSCALTSLVKGFHSQHRTPRLPQLHTKDALPQQSEGASPSPLTLHVGYLLHRHPVVKPTLHPLERSFGFMLEKEHQTYSRHPGVESATHFFRDHASSIDSHQRTDPQAIRRDFYGLESYQDAMQATLQRFTQVPPRVQPTDFTDVAAFRSATSRTSPPARHSLQRKLDDYLYFLVRYADDEEANWKGKWGVPFTALRQSETLRMAADRCLQEPHQDQVEAYVWGCGPQGTVMLPSQLPDTQRLFLFSATYLAGRPKFDALHPRIADHAWVSRREMRQYRADFVSDEVLELLLDVSADAYYEDW